LLKLKEDEVLAKDSVRSVFIAVYPLSLTDSDGRMDAGFIDFAIECPRSRFILAKWYNAIDDFFAFAFSELFKCL
jgi:hypothetical protein